MNFGNLVSHDFDLRIGLVAADNAGEAAPHLGEKLLQIDAFVLVVQWGTTSRQFLQATLHAEPRIAEKCIGSILNKADIKKLQLYRTPGSSEAYLTEYSAYFQDSA